MTSSPTPNPARVQARAALTHGRVSHRLYGPADVVDQAALTVAGLLLAAAGFLALAGGW